MSILIDSKTKVIIQGITGAEGARACKYMKEYGTKVIAGVTPGKGGQKIEKVPVFDTVAEVVKKFGKIDATMIVVPSSLVKDAVLEAIDSGIKLVHILTENISPKDTSYFVEYAEARNVRIIGPSSIGIISPSQAKIGSIGSGEISEVFTKGNVGVMSKSGGMTSEISWILTQAGIGQSTALGIGGDIISGSAFADIAQLFEKDKQTKAIVMFGEVGGTQEEDVAELVRTKKIKKPIIAFIGGEFTHMLPNGTVLGHAGAIVSGGKGGYKSKIQILKKSGIIVAKELNDIPELVKKALKK